LKKLRATENIDNPIKELQQRWIHIAVDYLFNPIERACPRITVLNEIFEQSTESTF